MQSRQQPLLQQIEGQVEDPNRLQPIQTAAQRSRRVLTFWAAAVLSPVCVVLAAARLYTMHDVPRLLTVMWALILVMVSLRWIYWMVKEQHRRNTSERVFQFTVTAALGLNLILLLQG